MRHKGFERNHPCRRKTKEEEEIIESPEIASKRREKRAHGVYQKKKNAYMGFFSIASLGC